MKATWTGKHAVRFDDGTCWPRLGTDAEWQARYGTANKFVLAAYVGAFEALCAMPAKRRAEVVRALRATAAKWEQ